MTTFPPAEKQEEEAPTVTAGSGGAVRGGGRGKKGKGGRDRGTIVLTALEQEMVDWAFGGFQPIGPQGIQPTLGIYI